MSAKSTKKVKPRSALMRAEYRRADLGTGTRGKHYAEFTTGNNLVLLEPDVAEVFGTQQAVNEALRSLIAVAERSTRAKPRRRAPRKPVSRSTGTR